MIAEVICVGSELLMGQIVNTNARYLSQNLAELGISLFFESVVGDNMQRLKEQLQLSGGRSDIVILTGGLGPTQDDLTKWAVAEVLGLEMFEDAESKKKIEEMLSLRKINGEITKNNYRQAQFPLGSIILDNIAGTAPSCIVEAEKCTYILLPGPPHELKSIFERHVFDYLSKKTDARIDSRFVKVFGIGESKLETILGELIDKQTNPSIAMYAGGQIITVRVTAKVNANESTEELLSDCTNKIVDILGDSVYSLDNEKLEEVVLSMLAKKGETLSIAESLTGGMLSSIIVSVPGASNVLVEGIVSYSNEAKVRLGVDIEVLNQYSAVSAECAEAMAKAVMDRSGSDWAISTTGVAGPGADENGNEAGTYYCCILNTKGSKVIKREVGGGRERVRTNATLSALNQLRLELK